VYRVERVFFKVSVESPDGLKVTNRRWRPFNPDVNQRHFNPALSEPSSVAAISDAHNTINPTQSRNMIDHEEFQRQGTRNDDADRFHMRLSFIQMLSIGEPCGDWIYFLYHSTL
jgi:hypothetical protein